MLFFLGEIILLHFDLLTLNKRSIILFVCVCVRYKLHYGMFNSIQLNVCVYINIV